MTGQSVRGSQSVRLSLLEMAAWMGAKRFDERNFPPRACQLEPDDWTVVKGVCRHDSRIYLGSDAFVLCTDAANRGTQGKFQASATIVIKLPAAIRLGQYLATKV